MFYVLSQSPHYPEEHQKANNLPLSFYEYRVSCVKRDSCRIDRAGAASRAAIPGEAIARPGDVIELARVD